MSGITFDLPGFQQLRRPPPQDQQQRQQQQGQMPQEDGDEDDALLTAALLASTSAAASSSTSTSGGTDSDARRRSQKDRGFGVGAGAQAAAAAADAEEEEEWGRGEAYQELLLPWHCPSCTLRNPASRLLCEACGLVNKRRERLRAQGQEERRSLLARRAEEQRGAAERMADLDDLEEVIEIGDDDDKGGCVGGSGGGKRNEVVVVIDLDEEEEEGHEVEPTSNPPARSAQPRPKAKAATSSAASAGPLVRLQPMLLHGGTTPPFAALPPDLVLHALHFLHDPVAYSDLRTLAKGWGRLAEHESLWRPLAEARFEPPVPPPSSHRTPTPVAASSAAPASSAASASSAGGGARRESLGLPASWSCKACGLLQADRFGLHCEFCQAEREIVTSTTGAAGSSPSSAAGAEEPSCPFIKIKTYDELAEVWRSTEEEKGAGGAAAAAAASASADAADRPLYSEERKRKADEAAREASSRLMTGPGSRPEGHVRLYVAGTGPKNVWAVAEATGDWYFLYKVLSLDEALAAKWDSLHRGYEWLVHAARAALRSRLYMTREEVVAHDDSLISIPESFAKAVNKLTRRDWPLLWECMRVELGLQAEALRRDVLRHLGASINAGPGGGGSGASGGGGGMGAVRAYRLFLEELLKAFQVFAQWAFEICAFFGKLNDQISGERFRATTSTLGGCGVREGQATPYISELALLSFRDRVLQHFAVRSPLLGAMEGDAGLAFGALWGPGVDLTAGAGVGAGEKEETGVEPEESEVDRRVLRARTGDDSAAGMAAAAEEKGKRRRVIENVADLLQALGKVCEELDVPGEGAVAAEEGGVALGPAYRRYILRPLRDTLAEMRVDGVGAALGGGGKDEEDAEEGVRGVGGLLKEEELCGAVDSGCGGGGGGRAWGRGSFRRQRSGGLGDGVERLAKRMRLV